jgi:hypothetical protein
MYIDTNEIQSLRLEHIQLQQELKATQEELIISQRELVQTTQKLLTQEREYDVLKRVARNLNELVQSAEQDLDRKDVITRALIEQVLRLERELEKLRTESSK